MKRLLKWFLLGRSGRLRASPPAAANELPTAVAMPGPVYRPSMQVDGQMPRFARLLSLSAVVLAFLLPLSWSALAFFDRFERHLFPLHWLQDKVRVVSANVIVGPYPDRERLAQLKAAGVTAVVSLMNRNLIYEDGLIDNEKREQEALGLRFYNFPMNSSEPPGSPLNDAALRQLREVLAAQTTGKVYVHCYLGKHRVGFAVNMLNAAAQGTLPPLAGAASRPVSSP